MPPLNEDSQIDVRKLKLNALSYANGHETKQFKIEIKADSEKRLISGYASTFDGWDSYIDTIVKGAFVRTIAEKHEGREHSLIKFLWQHAWADPLGLPTVLREDSHGLEFEAKVSDPTDLGRRALVLAEEKVVDGLSIGYDIFPGGAEWLDPSEISEDELAALLASGVTLDDLFWMTPRRLTAIDLWEVSLVTFPANTEARVEVVKSMARTLVPGWRPEGAKASPSAKEPADAGTVAVVSERGQELHLHFKSVEEVEAFAKSWGGAPTKVTHPAPKSDEGDATASALRDTLAEMATDLRSL